MSTTLQIAQPNNVVESERQQHKPKPLPLGVDRLEAADSRVYATILSAKIHMDYDNL